MGLNTTLGVSNVSFGMPNREEINSAFFRIALAEGLSAAIMNPYSESMMSSYREYISARASTENLKAFREKSILEMEQALKNAKELSKMGVEAFGAEGDEFDPNMHNAMMMVDDENHKEGEIVTVFQKGYKKGEKIIRYAMVTVAN